MQEKFKFVTCVMLALCQFRKFLCTILAFKLRLIIVKDKIMFGQK